MGSKTEQPPPSIYDTVDYITPYPTYVIKTQREKSGDKVFVNLCTAEEMWNFPAILVGELREDTDKRGRTCQCVDAVVHPAAVRDEPQEALCSLILKKVSEFS